jgi:hypothetical protein
MENRSRTLQLFLVAYVARLTYLIVFTPSFTGDYWAMSDALLRDGSLAINGIKTTDFEPLYPGFIALSRFVTRDYVLLVQLLQIAAASLGAVFAYRLALVLTGNRRCAAITAGLYACYPLLVHEGVIQSDNAILTTLLIGFAAAFAAATTTRDATIAGVWLGLVALTRTMALPLIPLSGISLWVQRRRREAVALTIVSAALVAPMPIRNYLVNRSWVPTRSGMNLFVGNHPYTAGLVPDYTVDLLQDQAFIVTHAAGTSATEPVEQIGRNDTILRREALAYMAQDPLETAGQKLRNVVYFFWPLLVPYYETTADSRIVVLADGQLTVVGYKSRPAIEHIAYTGPYVFVLSAAFAGLYLRRSVLYRDAILWCIVVTWVAVYTAFFPATRYRAPISFVLLFYAAVALERILPTIIAVPGATDGRSSFETAR